MSYKLLQISQLSAVTDLHDNYDNYPIYKNDLFMITAGTQSGSLSTVKATLQDVTHALYNINNTQAPILCAGVSPNQRVYFPTTFDVGIGQDFSDLTLPATLTVNGTISSNEIMTVGNGTTSIRLSGDLKFKDDDKALFGDSNDLSLYHSGSHGYAVNITGDYVIQNEANDKDITLKTDDGSGGVTT